MKDTSFFNQLLQKKQKLTKSSYYSAMNAMKEGREVGRNGRPPIFEMWKRPNFGTGWSVTPMRVIVQL